MISSIDIFHSYDYYNTTGAMRDLTKTEKDFYDFCVDNHEEICNEDMNQEVQQKASALWMKIL